LSPDAGLSNLRAASRLPDAPDSDYPGLKNMLDLAAARRQMIEQQVRAWEVLDADVLSVMERVPREEFAPAAYRELAFADLRVPLGHGQSMLPPKLEGRILQSLAIQPGDRALEAGTGSGFFAACLASLARDVRSLEIFPDLADAARSALGRTGVHNVTVETVDAMALTADAKYDVIALTGSLPIYDPRFERVLAVGGRLFVVTGQGPVMEAWRITRHGAEEWVRESLFETVIEPLINAPEPPKFVF
jgi:protein-L-isoaspartate(D-aspartate) O-methyltransferase